jgi:glutamine synthetase
MRSELDPITEVSEGIRKALGDHVFDAFIKNKKIELDLYRSQVTDYELRKYLPILYVEHSSYL